MQDADNSEEKRREPQRLSLRGRGGAFSRPVGRLLALCVALVNDTAERLIGIPEPNDPPNEPTAGNHPEPNLRPVPLRHLLSHLLMTGLGSCRPREDSPPGPAHTSRPTGVSYKDLGIAPSRPNIPLTPNGQLSGGVGPSQRGSGLLSVFYPTGYVTTASATAPRRVARGLRVCSWLSQTTTPACETP